MTDRLLDALVDICGPDHARAGRSVDLVSGSRARYVAVPGSAEAVADLLVLAAGEGLTAVPRGSGSKIDWGTPRPATDLIVDTGRLLGLWDHDPDELRVEVAAGTPVRSLQAALALQGQRLPADPPSPSATVGGMLAVNEAGPSRYAFGPPADHVERLTSVDEVLTSAVLRLQPLPQARRWVLAPLPRPAEMARLTAEAREHSPVAIETDLPVGGEGTLAALIEGDQAVQDRAERLAAAWGARVTPTAPQWWGRYPFNSSDVALRLSVSPVDLPATLYTLADAAGGPVAVRGSAGAGSVHAVLPGTLSAERIDQIVESLRHVLMARNGRAVLISAPLALAARVELAGPHDFF